MKIEGVLYINCFRVYFNDHHRLNKISYKNLFSQLLTSRKHLASNIVVIWTEYRSLFAVNHMVPTELPNREQIK